MTSFTVSFIVPVLNGEACLRRCLASIRAQLKPGDELLVVDNGSTDGTIVIARIHEGLTVAGLRNAGAASSSGAVLAFIDSDCVLLDGWRNAVAETLSDPDVAVTGAMPLTGEDATWVERAWGSLKYRERRRVKYIPAMTFVIRRSAFEAVKGFDANLITDEDSDICTRLSGAGFVTVEEPRVAAVHLGNPRTLRSFVAKERWHATSIMSTMRLHGIDKPMTMTFAFMACGVLSLALLVFAITGRGGFVPVVLLLLFVPVATVVFRLCQYRNFGSAPALVILYGLFYIIRSLQVITSVLPGRNAHR
jgi:glycosyltransferase involved in cell wall biosynthesis